MTMRNYAVRTCVAGLAVWLSASGPASGQPAAPATRPACRAPAAGAGVGAGAGADADAPTVVRTYNIGDLVRTVPDYPLPPTAGEGREENGTGGGGGCG